MPEPKARKSLDVPWRRFDPERRQRIGQAVRHLLRVAGRHPDGLDPVVADLEMWAAWHKRDPEQQISDTDLYSRFPREVCNAARALTEAIGRYPRADAGRLKAGMTLGDMIDGKWSPAADWRDPFWDEWASFAFVLNALADSALPNTRPQDLRLRSLEKQVLGVLRTAGLSWCTNQRAADILSEIKAHALERPFPSEATARLAALRRAVKNVSADSSPDGKSATSRH